MPFDPKAYLAAKNGEPEATESKDFDPKAYLRAKTGASEDGQRFPWEEEKEETSSYNEDVKALKNTKVPTTLEGVGNDLKGIGRTFAAGAGAVATSVRHPIETIKNPHRRREFERGLDNMLTLGYGQKLAARVGNALGDKPDVALGPETFSGAPVANTQALDRERAPGFREAGSIAGLISPGATSTVAGGAGKLAKVATGGIPGVAPSLIRGVVGYEASAPVLAGLSADAEGHRLETARDVATDPTGLILAAGSGALVGAGERLASNAAGKVEAGAKAGLTTGEQNAGIRKVRKLDDAAGTDDVFLNDLFERHPEVKKAAYLSGAKKPATVGRVVERVLDKTTSQIDDAYDKMVKADRHVTPLHIDRSFEGMISKALAEGDSIALAVLRRERAKFNAEYENFGKLSPTTLRGLKASAGKAAFPDSGIQYPPEVRAKIWGVYADAIEQQAVRTPGVDPLKLKQLNKDTQILMAAKDAIAERVTAQKANRKSIGATIAGAVGKSTLGAGVGGIIGGPLGAVVGVGGPPALKALAGAGRRANYALSRSPRVGDALNRIQPGTSVNPIVRTGREPNTKFEGQTEPGNIDLTNRPRVKNADGSISTIRSLGVNIDGDEVLIPTVSEDGRIMTDDEAVEQYKRTGRHLGKFNSVKASNAAAQRLHEEQERMGDKWGRPLPEGGK